MNATSGAKLWSYAFGYGTGPPVVASGLVFVSVGSSIYALNAADGTWVWNYTTGGDVNSAPAVAGGVVYVGSGLSDGNLYALNASSGEKLWNFSVGSPAHNFSPCPVLGGGVVYVVGGP